MFYIRARFRNAIHYLDWKFRDLFEFRGLLPSNQTSWAMHLEIQKSFMYIITEYAKSHLHGNVYC